MSERVIRVGERITARLTADRKKALNNIVKVIEDRLLDMATREHPKNPDGYNMSLGEVMASDAGMKKLEDIAETMLGMEIEVSRRFFVSKVAREAALVFNGEEIANGAETYMTSYVITIKDDGPRILPVATDIESD